MNWTICGQTAAMGEKKRIELFPAGLPEYKMPATMICGAKAGKNLVITASIHSGEYPGVPASIRLAKTIDTQKLTGNLLIVHCVNISGFWAKSPGRVPEDGGNLNGDYPGSANGRTTAQIADFFVSEIFPHTDFLLDLHSGGPTEPLSPCLFFPKAEKVREESLAVAKALDIPYLIESTATTGEYSYAANYMNVPGLLLERGYCGYCREDWIQAYEKDLRLFLGAMGAYDFPEEQSCKKILCTDTIYLTSSHKGLWYPAIKEGMHINAGQLLGHIENFWGETIGEYFAEADGVIHYYTSGLAVVPGAPLAAYSTDSGMSGL